MPPPGVPPSRLTRHYVVLSGLRWFPVGLVLPVLVLTMSGRGLSLSQIGAAFALYSGVVLVLELPTGGLADTLGRRSVLLLSAALTIVGFSLYAVATTFAGFAVAVAIEATGRALGSGPLAAWFVDAVHVDSPEADLQPALARAQAAETGGLALGAILGGLLPLWAATALPTTGDDPLLATSVPLLVGAALTVGFAVAVAAWVGEPQRPRSTPAVAARAVPATVHTALRAAAATPMLRRLLLRSLALGGTLAGIELLVPGQLADAAGSLTGGTTAYGLLAAVGFGAAAGGALVAPTLSRRWGSKRVVAAAPALAALAVLLLAAPELPLVAFGYCATYLMLGVGDPPAAGLLHEATDADVRSTMLSAESLSQHVGGIAMALTLGGVVAAAGAFAATALIAGCLLLAALAMVSG